MPKTTIEYEAHVIEHDADGVITREEYSQNKKTVHKQEPAYIKLYIQDVLYMSDMPQGLTNVVYELLKYTSYAKDGLRVYLPTGLKEEIIKELETTKASFNNSLSRLCKGNILKRIGTGIYQLNPYIFGRGEWADIDNIRATWNYDAIRGRTFSAVFHYKDEAQTAPEAAQEPQEATA